MYFTAFTMFGNVPCNRSLKKKLQKSHFCFILATKHQMFETPTYQLCTSKWCPSAEWDGTLITCRAFASWFVHFFCSLQLWWALGWAVLRRARDPPSHAAEGQLQPLPLEPELADSERGQAQHRLRGRGLGDGSALQRGACPAQGTARSISHYKWDWSEKLNSKTLKK